MFELDKEALKASDIKGEEIIYYLEKLNDLYNHFSCHQSPHSNPLDQARVLFRWLWEEKPNRYQPQGSFKLNEVIDNQLSKDKQTVGNCLGLTLLYNCLLRKMGIYAQALYLENAFEIGPHVLTLLQTKESSIDIENILPEGFDYKGHRNHPLRITWGDQELIADVYLSMGNEFFKREELMEALKNYNKAIHLNPRYEKARLNKIILLHKIGQKKN